MWIQWISPSLQMCQEPRINGTITGPKLVNPFIIRPIFEGQFQKDLKIKFYTMNRMRAHVCMCAWACMCRCTHAPAPPPEKLVTPNRLCSSRALQPFPSFEGTWTYVTYFHTNTHSQESTCWNINKNKVESDGERRLMLTSGLCVCSQKTVRTYNYSVLSLLGPCYAQLTTWTKLYYGYIL